MISYIKKLKIQFFNFSKRITNFEKKKKKFSIINFSMLKTITMFKMRLIETIIKIKVEIVNIVKIDVVKTKCRVIK